MKSHKSEEEFFATDGAPIYTDKKRISGFEI
jgi:hypothetical protein